MSVVIEYNNRWYIIMAMAIPPISDQTRLSRPKIHRLPRRRLFRVVLDIPFSMRRYWSTQSQEQKHVLIGVCAALLVVLLVFGLKALFSPSEVTIIQKKLSFLPTKSQISMPLKEEIHEADQALTFAVTDAKLNKTIVIQGENGKIVGRFAKIPMQEEVINDSTGVSAVDKTSQVELLSIISKH
jgi:hypothetical protein